MARVKARAFPCHSSIPQRPSRYFEMHIVCARQASLCVMEVEGGAEPWRMLGCNLANIDEWCINTVEGRIAPGFKWPEPGVNQ